jgi:hypothetical protein
MLTLRVFSASAATVIPVPCVATILAALAGVSLQKDLFTSVQPFRWQAPFFAFFNQLV